MLFFSDADTDDAETITGTYIKIIMIMLRDTLSRSMHCLRYIHTVFK